MQELTHLIDARESDPFGRARSSALLGLLQRAAEADSHRLGMDAAQLREACGGQWILARLRLSLLRPVGAWETLAVDTVFRGLSGALIYRDMTLRVGGQPVGAAVTGWVVGDPETRHMLLRAQLPPALRQPAGPGETLKRFRLPADPAPAGRYTVQYSDTDENGHMNNTRYADLCCNVLPRQDLERGWVRELELNYLGEALWGQTLRLDLTGEAWTRWVRGDLCRDGAEPAPCFQARLELAPAP